MEVEIILGRPGSGKTAKLISLVNAYPGAALLISLENPPHDLSERGLKETVALYVPDRCESLTLESIVEESHKAKATVVAIEYLELVPKQIDLGVLRDALKKVGVEHLILSSQLNRNHVSVSKDRIDAIQAKCTVLK